MIDFEHIVKDEVVYDVSDAVARAQVATKQDQMQLTDLSPNSALLGRVVQYIGETNAFYTKHYFYRQDADMEQESGSGAGAATYTIVDENKFNEFLASIGIATGQNVYTMDISINQSNTIVSLYYYDEDGTRVRIAHTFTPAQFTNRTGLALSGTMSPPANPDVLDVSMAWTRVDVQPSNGATITYNALNEELTIA